MLDDAFVLECREAAAHALVFAGAVERRVLVHERDLHAVAEVLMEPVEDAHALVAVARQHEMAHEDAAPQAAVRCEVHGADLAHHGADGARGVGEIVRCRGVFARGGLVDVLEIRQVDGDLARKHSDGLLCLIGARVVDDGEREPSRPRDAERRKDLRHVVRRRHEVERRSAARLLLEEDLREPLLRDLLSLAAVRYLMVLAVAAAQVAVGEKDRARALAVRAAREAWFLPGMERDEGDARPRARAAVAVPARAVDAAVARAERAA